MFSQKYFSYRQKPQIIQKPGTMEKKKKEDRLILLQVVTGQYS